MELLCKSVDDCAKFPRARLALAPLERFWAAPPSIRHAYSPVILADPLVCVNQLQLAIRALHVLRTLGDLIVNRFNLQSQEEIIGVFRIPLEQRNSSIPEIFAFSLPNSCEGRH